MEKNVVVSPTVLSQVITSVLNLKLNDLPDLALLNMSSANAIEELRQKVLVHSTFIEWLSHVDYSCGCWQFAKMHQEVERKIEEWVSFASTIAELLDGYAELLVVQHLLLSMDSWPTSQKQTGIVYPKYVKEKASQLALQGAF